MRPGDLARLVDDRYPARQSLLLRYRRCPGVELDETSLARASLREGSRIFFLTEQRGVAIHVVDETSHMETGTFEALVAAASLAECLRLGRRKVVFSSGGNLGLALSAYARRVGIESWSLCPLDTARGLDGTVYSGEGQHLVGIADPQQTRTFALALRERLRARLDYDPLIPTMEWRKRALRARGLLLAEHALETGVEFAAVAQTVSAGFGPLAVFEVLEDCVAGGLLSRLPRFLGVQQRANCIAYQRWKGVRVPHSSDLIVPTLFDRDPDRSFGTWEAFADLLRRSRGDMVTVDRDELESWIDDDVLAALRANGVEHAASGGRFAARSGLMALAGVRKAIDEGVLREGPVLVCMCDGTHAASLPPKIDFTVADVADVEALADRILEGA